MNTKILLTYLILSFVRSAESTLSLEAMKTLRGNVSSQKEISFQNSKYQQTLVRLEEHQIEKQEQKKLERKWEVLNSQDPNNTVYGIPRDWLLPTAKHNITFNVTHAKSTLGKILAALIRKHQNYTYVKKSDHISRTRSYIEKAKPVFPSSFKNNLGSAAKKIPSNLGKQLNATMMNRSYEYPNQNNSLRSQIFKQWEDYYQCLQSKRSFRPQIHYAFPGEAIMLTCHACVRPGGATRIQWHMATARTKKEVQLDFTKKISALSKIRRLAIRDKGLHLMIFGLNEGDGGNYSCSQYQTVLSMHLLQIADQAENLTKVWSEGSHGKVHPKPEINLPNFGLTVFTQWKNWTSCSRCGSVGKRFRIGICTVKASNFKAPAVLQTFREGVPCRSRLLPKYVHNHPNIQNRKSEIMEGFCKEPCPKVEKYIVKDEKGQILEEADNSKGVYSMLQKLPNLPPQIKRKIMFYNQWDTAIIQCPGNFQSDIPVRWFIDYQPIHAKGDRVYVTPSHLLMVEELGLADSNLYSCWQGSKLVGTVRLVVSQPIRMSFAQQISTISMILIVFTFVVIFGRAFCNALRTNRQIQPQL